MKDLNDFYCSDIALEHTVPLIGTATQGNVWFFLEYSGRWGIKAFEESTLPQDVKNHLKYASQPGVRVRIGRSNPGNAMVSLSL